MIRASVPMYLLAQRCHQWVLSVRSMVKEVMKYLADIFISETTDPAVFHKECIRLVKNLYMFDCLDTQIMPCCSLEVRTPFLDMSFVNYVMNMDPIYKTCSSNIEKYILRNCVPDGMLPPHVLWRQKEQFSDGVGYEWLKN